MTEAGLANICSETASFDVANYLAISFSERPSEIMFTATPVDKLGKYVPDSGIEQTVSREVFMHRD